MKRNTTRMLTMHAGSLARPPDLREMVLARSNGQAYDPEALARRLRSAVAEVVRQQIAVGLDSINDGKVLIPGVVGHYSDFIEHPALVAERLVRYVRLVGRDNVMAGTDCGLGPRVGHPKIAWAKFEALVEGARLATKQLWG